MRYRLFAIGVLLICAAPQCFGLRPIRVGDPANGISLLPNGWPQFSGVIVRSSVSIKGGLFVYQYSVANPASNRLPIYGFQVDIRKNPVSHPFSYSVEADAPPGHIPEQHDALIRASPSVSIRNQSAPPTWRNDGASWDGLGNGDCGGCVKPGSNLGGFEFSSTNPPGIRNFLVDGFDINIMGTSITDEMLKKQLISLGYRPDIPQLYAELNRAVEFQGVTVAPVPYPRPISLLGGARHIKSLAQEAHRVGWIRSETILKELDKRLDGLSDSHSNEQSRLAAAAVIRYCSRQRMLGELSAQAEVLIKANVSYLLSSGSEGQAQ